MGFTATECYSAPPFGCPLYPTPYPITSVRLMGTWQSGKNSYRPT